MSKEFDPKAPQEKQSHGLFHRLFGDAHHSAPSQPDDGGKTELNLADIQGIILRTYRMPIVRHFLLQVGIPSAARKLLGRLASGDETDAPQITTAKDWHVGLEPGPGDNLADPPRCKPDYCVNLGVTWPGLLALEVNDRVPNFSFRSFKAFIDGAAARAASVGDTGPNAPSHWLGGFGTGNDHVVLTLHSNSPLALSTYTDRLSALFAEDHAFQEIWLLTAWH